MIQLTIYFVFATLNRYNFILYYNGNKILFYTDNVKTAEHQSLAYKCTVPLEMSSIVLNPIQIYIHICILHNMLNMWTPKSNVCFPLLYEKGRLPKTYL